MAKYTLTESYTVYRDYMIEADSPQEAKKLWEAYGGDTDTIMQSEREHVGDDYDIDYLINHDTGESWAGEDIPGEE